MTFFWNLFGKEVVRLEKTWNISQRILVGLPRQSHRYLIEPSSSTKHLCFVLKERYMRFAKTMEASEKMVMRKKVSSVKRNCRSNTGESLWNSMKLALKIDISEITIGSTCGLIYTQFLMARNRGSILQRSWLVLIDCASNTDRLRTPSSCKSCFLPSE